MSDSYIIEVSSRAAGIVVRDKAGFRFFAAAPQFFRLEGQLFRSAREAERAAAQFAGERSSSPQKPERGSGKSEAIVVRQPE